MTAPETEIATGTPQEKSRKPEALNKAWLFLALIGFLAAFLFQWKNSLDQSSIAETDSGSVVRVKFEEGYFKFFSDKEVPLKDIFVCDADGKILAALIPAPQKTNAFTPELRVSPEVAAEPRFVNIVVPSLKSDGIPLVLKLENPLR